MVRYEPPESRHHHLATENLHIPSIMTHEPLTIELNENLRANSKQPGQRRFLLTQSPTNPDDYILSIDHSSLESFNVCARKAEYALVKKRQPVRNTSALSYGTAVHKALETGLLAGTF